MKKLFFIAMLSSSVVAEPISFSCKAGASSSAPNRFTHEELSDSQGNIFRVVNDSATSLQWNYCFYGQTYNAITQDCDGEPEVPWESEPGNPYKRNDREHLNKVVLEEQKRLSTINSADLEQAKSEDTLWRAPNLKELLTIYNWDCVPAVFEEFSYQTHKDKDLMKEWAEITIQWQDKVKYEWKDGKSVKTILIHKDSPEKIMEKGQKIFTGKAFSKLLTATDSFRFRTNNSYHAIAFDGIETPIHGWTERLGMLRMVRKQPNQTD